MKKNPEFLQKGDLVAMVCPASFVSGELADATRLLESWGLKVQRGQTVGNQFHQYSGPDSLRAADLQAALDDPAVKMILAARGGYGTVRIIDELDFTAFVKNPKWLVGFSDITVLHSHIHACFGTPTIHGQMPTTIPDGTTASLESLRKALFGEELDYSYQAEPADAAVNRSGTASGTLIGGNLALLQSLTGSRSEMDYDGKILLLEDVGEAYYNIDRMLWTLKRAGKLDKLAGLIIGGFTSLKDDNTVGFGSTVAEIVLEKVQDLPYPIAFGFPCGHIPDNQALMLGRKCTLTVDGARVNLRYSATY